MSCRRARGFESKRTNEPPTECRGCEVQPRVALTLRGLSWFITTSHTQHATCHGSPTAPSPTTRGASDPPLPRSTAGRQNAAIAPTARANSDPGPTIVAAQRARTSVHGGLLCLWPWIQGAEQDGGPPPEVPVARCGRLGSGRRPCTEVRARRAVRVLRPRERARHHVGPHTRRAPPLGASTTPGGLWGMPTALAPAGLACGAPTAPAEAAKAVLADMGLQHVWPQRGGMWPSRPNPRPLRAT